MNIHEALQAVKGIVEECEDVIKNGRLAVSTRNIEIARFVVKRSKELSSRLRDTLEEVKSALDKYGKEDNLAKYTGTYFRMVVLVSMPYVSMILRDIAAILEREGYENEAEEAEVTAETIETLVSTLKSQR